MASSRVTFTFLSLHLCGEDDGLMMDCYLTTLFEHRNS
jgi:hypothetical protein